MLECDPWNALIITSILRNDNGTLVPFDYIVLALWFYIRALRC